MVCSFPRRFFVLEGHVFSPFLGLPVETTNRIETFFIGSPSSYENQRVVFLVVVEGAIRPLRGDDSCGFLFFPEHGGGVEGPEIVHVVGIWVMYLVPAYPPKKTI